MIFCAQWVCPTKKKKNYETVKAKFDAHFVKHRNPIFERVQPTQAGGRRVH